jgi:hypothetical protein
MTFMCHFFQHPVARRISKLSIMTLQREMALIDHFYGI